MPQFEKHFTPEEANGLLPELREILTWIKEIRDRLTVDWEQAAPVLRAASQNGGGKEGHAYLTDLQQVNARLRRLSELGVQLKDLDRGLVDFPAWRGDREVFLCWRLGEGEVAYWHDLETGYASRQRL
jgi:hypothetical protein